MSISTASLAAHAATGKSAKAHLYIPDAPDLVIVAGVSGSGRNAFLSRLREGQVPDGLDLPDGALRWPVVGTSRNPVWPRGAPGAILDYDMNGRGLSAGTAYSDDPALAFVHRARRVTVVNVRPPLYQIISQLSQRAATKALAAESGQQRLFWRLATPAFRWAERMLPKRVAKAIRRRTPFRYEKKVQSAARKLSLYKRDWLDERYARWAEYLDELERSGTPVRQVFVEPTNAPFRWTRVDPDRSIRQSGILDTATNT